MTRETKGGAMSNENEITDLFEQWESLPNDVQNLIDQYNLRLEGNENGYEVCKEFLKDVRKKGYTFEYGLDGIPYNLQKLKKPEHKWGSLEP